MNIMGNSLVISGIWGFATVAVVVAGFVYYTYMKYRK